MTTFQGSAVNSIGQGIEISSNSIESDVIEWHSCIECHCAAIYDWYIASLKRFPTADDVSPSKSLRVNLDIIVCYFVSVLLFAILLVLLLVYRFAQEVPDREEGCAL